MVALTAGHRGRPDDLHHLRDLACLRQRRLLLHALRVAAVLAVPRLELHADGRRRRLAPVRLVVGAVARAAGAGLPAGLPADLLLLPQGLLPRLLGVAAGLRGRRAAREVHRRDPLPAGDAERPPVLLLPGPAGRRDPDLRRGARLPRRERRLGPRGPRHPGPAAEHRADLGVHPVLPLLPAHHRRQAPALLRPPGALPAVGLGGRAQRPPHAAGLVLADQRRGRRPLCVPGGQRRIRRSEVLLR
ncbi:Putative succinate dehydrogenase (membrane anchor subunit) (Succinic dehydrogenase) [Actinacidiphila bryophytorum]|uniref:Succinate dehydrogenase (Membrane anchor subunit) (Succinic dehydrogenase) n=1 Tax=Actinacidiphila bryophytorum TaxID=1436133 RepID=A0A9W4GYU9_9ACTN|nr:Putative succinate dehydrogenase (membrane anchor subunit) (Succinic dehydrogenase) [Actinacidiphila bryophytorum]